MNATAEDQCEDCQRDAELRAACLEWGRRWPGSLLAQIVPWVVS